MAKKYTVLLIMLSFVLCVMPVCAHNSVMKEYYVSVNGDDGGDGSREAPFKSIERARDEVRKINGNMTGDIIVNIESGRYETDHEIRLRKEDSGTNGFEIIYRGSKDGMPEISGGRQITGWQKGENGLWQASCDAEFVRELYINGTPGIRAHSSNMIAGDENYKGKNEYSEGFYIDKSKMGLYKNPQDIQLHWVVYWKSKLVNVRDIVQDPENENRVIVKMDDVVWNNVIKYNAKEASIWHTVEFTVENAFELLDEPGEFYYDKYKKILYYMPREGENPEIAEIIAPRVDQLLKLWGTDVDNKLKNVRFENICFEHSCYSIMEQTYAGGQGELPNVSGVPGRATPGSVDLRWTDNVDIEDCKFFGLASVGLSLTDGVKNSEIKGNVFTDIGSSAIVMGQYEHYKYEEPKKKDGPANISWKKPWTASYVYSTRTYIANECINDKYDSRDEDDISPCKVWYNEPWAEEQGIKSWIRLDLEDEYSIDSIRLSFEEDSDKNTVSNIQKSNIEVLVSNDKHFDTYKTLAQIGDNKDMVTEIKGCDEKYRYVMVRKTAAEPFAISGIWVYSYDEKPKGWRGICTDNVISNNYITRAATENMQGIGILVYYTLNSVVEHNEIKDMPYTGISVGWGWDRTPTKLSGNNKINYNRIDRVMQNVNDGAGIYTLGILYNSEIKGNYISNVINDWAGIYLDNGSTGITVENNIITNAGHSVLTNTGTRDNTVKGTYTDGGTYLNYSSEKNNVGQEKIFSVSDIPYEAAMIAGDAGLEEEYEYIRERAENFESPYLKGPYQTSAYNRVYNLKASDKMSKLKSVAKTILKNGNFGILPWQFNPELKDKLQFYINRAENAKDRTDETSSGHIEEQFMLLDTLDELYASCTHPGWDKMLEMCEDKINTASTDKKEGGYEKAAIAEFKKSVNAVKSKNPQSEAEKFAMSTELEKAYEKLEASAYKADITSVYIPYGRTEIDKETHTVNVTVWGSCDFKKLMPKISVSDGAQVAVDLSKKDFSQPLDIPVYNKKLGNYVHWTLNILSSAEQNIEAGWKSVNKNTIIPQTDGKVTIQPYFEPAMYTKPIDKETEFEICAYTPDVKDGIGIIFASQSDSPELNARYEKNTYCELDILGETIQLCKVMSGEKTVCAEVKNTRFKYGEANKIKINAEKEGELLRVKVNLNGRQLFDTLVSEKLSQKGFFGIRTQNEKIILGGFEQ